MPTLRTNLVLLPDAPLRATRADAVTAGVGATEAAAAAGAPVHVRVANPREGRLRADLEAFGAEVACVLLARTTLPQDLRDADVELRRRELQLALTPGRIGLIPEIGGAAALARLPELLAAVDRLASVAVDIEALAENLGAPDATAQSLQEPLLAQAAVAATAARLPWTVGALSFAPGDRARLAARAHALGASGLYVSREAEVAGFNTLFRSPRATP